MPQIQQQRDLATLPQPCLIQTAPVWLRWFTIGILAFGMIVGAFMFSIGFENIGRDGSLVFMLVSGPAATVCFLVLVILRPDDWRAWINFAATADGLYLVAGRRRVVFVPWLNVLDMRTKKMMTGKGGMRDVPLFRLRMSEDDWAAFGKLSSIKGTGEVRDFLVASAGIDDGPKLVADLKAFRAQTA